MCLISGILICRVRRAWASKLAQMKTVTSSRNTWGNQFHFTIYACHWKRANNSRYSITYSPCSPFPLLLCPAVSSVPEVWNIWGEQRQLEGGSCLGQNSNKPHPLSSSVQQCQGQESATGACQSGISTYVDSSRPEVEQIQWLYCSPGSMWPLTFRNPAITITSSSSSSSMCATSLYGAVPVFRNRNWGAH